jgi:predicted component of type VI protein secretion system
MEAQLVVIRGADSAEIELFLPFLIGRSSDAALKIPHESVSREHCRIYEFDGELAVRDLGSRNGTYVNGQRIDRPTFLSPGDELTIGGITFRANYQIRRQVVLMPHAATKGLPTKTAPPDDETHADRQAEQVRRQAAAKKRARKAATASEKRSARKADTVGAQPIPEDKPKPSAATEIPVFENTVVDLPTSIPDLGAAPIAPIVGELNLEADESIPLVHEDEIKDFLDDIS